MNTIKLDENQNDELQGFRTRLERLQINNQTDEAKKLQKEHDAKLGEFVKAKGGTLSGGNYRYNVAERTVETWEDSEGKTTPSPTPEAQTTTTTVSTSKRDEEIDRETIAAKRKGIH